MDAGNPTSIDEYIAQQPPEIRERLEQVRRTIREVAPRAVEKISYRMPTFHQKENLIHFAAFKQHIGLFPGADGIEAFRERFNADGLEWSKGGVQLPNDRPLPLDLVREIAVYRVAVVEGRR
jgi:uncharacterized protein YdhG (YjbR/CyaY superfamily)